MSQALACSQCGAPLPSDAPGGVCPRCVLQLGWAGESAGEAASEPRPTAARDTGFIPPEPSELARHFPQLEILELLGRGGMGAVYKARQPALDRFVAVKVLPPEVGRDPSFAERFSREARALARLSHPNIVAIHDVGLAAGFYYFVMEFVDGMNLRRLLQDGALKPAEALAIVPQICEALQYAHDEGVVHRDIKPENILVDKKGRVKIADFGLAKLLGASPNVSQLTGTYQVMGTYHYMAPEQFERPQEVDHRADIYSLGVVFYELLTHELPIGRFALPSQKVEVDVRLDEVVLRALERDPPRRYQHASEVKTDVDAIVRGPLARPPVVQTPPPAAVAPSPRALSVPIKIEDVWGGFAEAHGVLRFDGDELLLEFDVRDGFFQAIRFSSKSASLRLVDLAAVTFKPGWWGHTIKVQASRFPVLAHLPGCDRGQIKLSIVSDDRMLGERLVAAVRLRLAGKPWDEALLEAERLPEQPAVAESAENEQKEEGYVVFGIGAVMVVAAVILLMMAFSQKYYHADRVFHALFWPGIGLLLGGTGCLYAMFVKRRRRRVIRFPEQAVLAASAEDEDGGEESEPSSPAGMLVMAGTMLIAAVVLQVFALWAYLEGSNSFHAFLWPGIGILFGSGGCLTESLRLRQVAGKAAISDAGKPEPAATAQNEEGEQDTPAGMLIMGGLLVAVALTLLALAFGARGSNHVHAFLWPGIGLLMGGGGCLSSAFGARRHGGKARSEAGKPDTAAALLDRARRQVAWPGLGLAIAAVIDASALLGLLAGVCYLVWEFGPPENMTIAYLVTFLAVRLACAPLQFAAARKMRRLENRRLAALGSMLALIPGSPGWLLGLPMGVWALVVFRRTAIQEAFHARAGKSRALWRLSAPIIAACGAGLGLTIWTYWTLPQPVANPSGRWITQESGQPRLAQEFADRLELRPAQIQNINDILEARANEYWVLEQNRARIVSQNVKPWSSGNARGHEGRVEVVIGPFATRLALLESRTWKQIDLVLDERQRGLARQYNLFADLFPAGRGRMKIEIQGDRQGPDRTHYHWTIEDRTWFSGFSTGGGGERLPRHLDSYWSQAISLMTQREIPDPAKSPPDPAKSPPDPAKVPDPARVPDPSE